MAALSEQGAPLLVEALRLVRISVDTNFRMYTSGGSLTLSWPVIGQIPPAHRVRNGGALLQTFEATIGRDYSSSLPIKRESLHAMAFRNPSVRAISMNWRLSSLPLPSIVRSISSA
jgi:hypothetical protein